MMAQIVEVNPDLVMCLRGPRCLNFDTPIVRVYRQKSKQHHRNDLLCLVNLC